MSIIDDLISEGWQEFPVSHIDYQKRNVGMPRAMREDLPYCELNDKPPGFLVKQYEFKDQGDHKHTSYEVEIFGERSGIAHSFKFYGLTSRDQINTAIKQARLAWIAVAS